MIEMLLGLTQNWRRMIGESSFFTNALYLMCSTFAVSALGFVFWALVTRSYPVAAVGLATTLLSVSGLVALLGLVGFDTTFVRFLPTTTHKKSYINSGFIVVTLASAVLAAAAATLLPFVIPKLAILHDALGWWTFVGATVIGSLCALCNAAFLAHKHAKYILIVTVITNVLKVTLPLFVTQGAALTIFILASGAQLIGLIISIALVRRLFSWRPSLLVNLQALRLVKKFSVSVYVSSVLNLLPPTLLPLIVIASIGAEHAAYYYMAFTIASGLYTIAYASAQSALAEGSHNQATLAQHVNKAARLIGILLVPAAIGVGIGSGLLLGVFGPRYTDGASTLLQLFACSALPVAAYSALGAIFKVQKHLIGVIGMNVAYAACILGAAILLVPVWGLTAVGISWLFGNVAACGIGAFFLRRKHKRGGK